MGPWQLARHNVRGSALRGAVLALSAAVIAALAMGTTLFVRGAEASLRLASERVGADIVVVPEGEVAAVGKALLMGQTTRVWMPAGHVDAVAALPGVAAASPQIYLSTLSNASCCAVSDMFLIVYDPETDFVLGPWLTTNLGHGLGLGQVVGGDYVFTPEGQETILIYGYEVTLVANLGPTGAGIDQSMYMTEETARDIARLSVTNAVEPLVIPDDSVSTVMVRLEPDADPEAVAGEIELTIPGVTAVSSLELFRDYREQLRTLRAVLLTTLVIALAASAALIGMVFTMATHARRRQVGVLRALGARNGYVFQTLMAEAAQLGLAGAAGGVLLAILLVYLFSTLITVRTTLPFLWPSLPTLALEALLGLALGLAVITLAVFVPAWRVSRLDPAVAMRE